MSTTYQTINPATEDVLETFEMASDEQSRNIVTAAHQAFLEWRKTDIQSRADILRKMAKLMRERQDSFAVMMTLSNRTE